MTAKDYSELHEAAALFIALGESGKSGGVTTGQRPATEREVASMQAILPLAEISSGLKILGRRKEIRPQSLEQRFTAQLASLAEEHGIITLLLVDDHGFPVIDLNPVVSSKALAAVAMAFGPALEHLDAILGRETGELLTFSIGEEQKLSLTHVVLLDRTLFLLVVSMDDVDIGDGIVSVKEQIVTSLT